MKCLLTVSLWVAVSTNRACAFHPHNIRSVRANPHRRTRTTQRIARVEPSHPQQRGRHNSDSQPPLQFSSAVEEIQEETGSPSTSPTNTEELNRQIQHLGKTKQFPAMLQLLDSSLDPASTFPANPATLTIAIRSLTKGGREGVEQAERLFIRLKQQQQAATCPIIEREAYEALMRGWNKYKARGGDSYVYDRCVPLLKALWKQQAEAEVNRVLDGSTTTYVGPTRSTYLCVLDALLRSDNGRRGKWIGQEAQRLVHEMYSLAQQYPLVQPNIVCINVALLAMTRSTDPEAAGQAVDLLHDVEQRFFSGDTELKLTAETYNVVLDSLARSNAPRTEFQAEDLLYHMDKMADEHKDTMGSCKPDVVSFNSVLNSWARSKNTEGPKRAEAILEHMENRFRSGESTVAPDSVSYNTVMTAWARSKRSIENTERILKKMETEYLNGNKAVEPTVITFNIFINAIAQSGMPGALEKSLATVEKMKSMGMEKERPKCMPDCVTYSTVIGVVGKTMSQGSGGEEKALELLEELESLFESSRDLAYRPSMQTYTAAINAIARGRKKPELAQKLVDKLEKGFKKGIKYMQPDCVCYCSLLNAYGWSDVPGRAKKCYAILKKMENLFESRTNTLAKPDIIACNAVLNACAFDPAATEDEKTEIMEIVVDVLEMFQSVAPKFGWPNHITYVYTLQSLANHVTDPVQRGEMAEATFLQCCHQGHVSVPVILNLFKSTEWSRFARLMGNALESKEGEQLIFIHKSLPEEWTRFAPNQNHRRDSRPGSKRRNSFKPSLARIASR